MGKEKKYCFNRFCRDLRKSGENEAFQKTGKFIEMKDIVILVKVDDVYNIMYKVC